VNAQWWRTPFRAVQTNLRLIDAGMDVEAAADFVVGHGANAWLVNTGGIYANHPSDLASQTANPELTARASSDLVADALAAAHRRDLRFIARMDFSKVLPDHARAHPEWLFVSSDGEHQVFNDLVTTCPSGPYFQEETFRIVDEVLERYAVDGFFFNWFMYSETDYAHRYLGPCHCSACAARFPADTGLPLPTSREHASYPAWTAWAYEMLRDLGSRLRKHIHDRREGVALILHETADLCYVEANNAIGREPWPLETTENVSAVRTHRPDVGIFVNSVAFLDFPYRMGAEEPERFAQYLIQAISRGANISTYMMGPPGAIPYPSLAVAGEITRFHRDHTAAYDGLRQASPVLLVRPKPPPLAATRSARVAEYRGLFSALQESHHPLDVVDRRGLVDLTPEQLRGYQLIVLPSLGALSAAESALLDRYAEAGGSLLLTDDTGFGPTGGQLAALDGLAVEGELTGAELLSAYAQVDDETILPLHGRCSLLTGGAGTDQRWPVLPQARFGPPEYCYGHQPSGHPGAVLTGHGRGRVAVVPWTVGRSYHEIGTSIIRDAIADLVSELAPRARVTTDLPTGVEVVLGRTPSAMVIHLISHVHATNRSYAEPVPVFDREVWVPGAAGQRAVALVAQRPLTSYDDGTNLVVLLPVLGRFEVITITEGE